MASFLKRRTLLLATALGGSTILLQACGGSDNDAPERNIVQLAQANPDLSILVEAVVAADLVDTLSTGNLTVFAPTNAAFAALLAELGTTKAALLADKPLLKAVLSYHVLGQRVASAEVPLGKALVPLAGGFFKIESSNGLRVTDGRNRMARITATDLQASNGVVHVVDRVLLPADKSIVATAQSLPDFSILVEAVVAAGLVDTLQGPGPFTVFAPTNAAFDKLPEGTVENLLKPENKAQLSKILTYHVVAGNLDAKAVVAAIQKSNGKLSLTTVAGGKLTASIEDGKVVLTDEKGGKATVTATDLKASNGIIHVIDAVLLPK